MSHLEDKEIEYELISSQRDPDDDPSCRAIGPGSELRVDHNSVHKVVRSVTMNDVPNGASCDRLC